MNCSAMSCTWHSVKLETQHIPLCLPPSVSESNPSHRLDVSLISMLLLNWYHIGTLIDEYGNIFKNKGKLNNFDCFEVLNEPDILNKFTVEEYTNIYDHLIYEIRQMKIDTKNKIKFIGSTLRYCNH